MLILILLCLRYYIIALKITTIFEQSSHLTRKLDDITTNTLEQFEQIKVIYRLHCSGQNYEIVFLLVEILILSPVHDRPIKGERNIKL